MARISDQLRESFEERIVTGQWPAGRRLDEVELASVFDVSRTPIREALISLATSGVIEKRPRKGWVVTELSPSRMCEMFEVMAELEATCANLAARRASRDELNRISAAHHACLSACKAGDTDEYYNLNEQFHLTVYEASNNAFLADMAGALLRRLKPYRRLQLRARGRMQSSFEEHRRIVEAILAGEPQLAADVARDHVVMQGERFTVIISSLESLSAGKEPRK